MVFAQCDGVLRWEVRRLRSESGRWRHRATLATNPIRKAVPVFATLAGMTSIDNLKKKGENAAKKLFVSIATAALLAQHLNDLSNKSRPPILKVPKPNRLTCALVLKK